MISAEYVQRLAKYNRWQNQRIFTSASELSDDQRSLDRGAFFKSIEATLNHLYWADSIWMHRLAGFDRPNVSSIADSLIYFDNWDDLVSERESLDVRIEGWAATAKDENFDGTHTWYSQVVGGELEQPRWMLFTHMFNHQAHHRGQVHAMLTSAGAKTEATDLPMMPE